ncbi:MAG: molybdopterin molybdotransferase MoeA [Alphaproteobacteria bacterium]|nr:molybdopterin molybdotransferase MoeA [Alphaproteobacteria bacterium]
MSAKPLLDDCFAHDPKRMPAREALELLRTRVSTVVGTETAPLDQAYGRLLAEQLIADRNVPAFDNVAVDGYAFAHRSLASDGGSRLRLLAGRSAAGQPFAGEIAEGSALRVLTGGALPDGADTALMQEDVVVDGDHVLIPAGVKQGANCRLAGEDMRKGQTVLAPPLRLRPQDVGVAAALGRTSLSVHRPLKVALVSSGDEIVPPGRPLAHGMTYDSNNAILKGLMTPLGVEISDQGIWPDRADVIKRGLADIARTHHAIITTGGASRGDEDHMVATVEALGRLHFWQIAVKPGRPLALGQIGDAVFIGLPGNPVAAMVCFLLFARPVLTALAGGGWTKPLSFLVPADFSMRKKPGRREYLRARLVTNEAGQQRVRKIEREGSGILTSLTEADGLIDVAEDVTSIAPGDPVPFLPFSGFGL